MLEIAHIDYRNFEEERYPSVGVYYMFKKSCGFGLCRQFDIDVSGCAKYGAEVVVPKKSYPFNSESKLLSILEINNVQGICTEPVDGISFYDLSVMIARIHLSEFMKRHPWIKNIARE